MAALDADTKRRLGQALGSDAAALEVSNTVDLVAAVTAGTVSNSKAVVAGTSKNVDALNITTSTITTLTATSLTATRTSLGAPTAINAAGSTQANATAINAAGYYVVSAVDNTTAVKLPTAAPGMVVTLAPLDTAAKLLQVFPGTGAAIATNAANAAYPMGAAPCIADFVAVTNTQWAVK